MKRSLKLALIPTAIAAVLTANSAFAGSEACFEVYPAAIDAVVTAHATKYNAAACIVEANRTGATAVNLEATTSTSIAYELTGDYDVDLQDIDGGTNNLHVVYIPTTDIPSGTVIEIKLTGAKWKGNANQMHLVQLGANYELVASSDGAFDGTDTITFLTKAGVTIGAGTRLAFTKNNAIDGTAAPANSNLIESPTFNIANTGCPTNAKVSIQATTAKTDGGNGFNIQGGVSKVQELADISPQFIMFDKTNGAAVYASGSASVTVEQVDAEDTNGTPRTLFVEDGLTPTSGDFVVNGNNTVVYPFRMVDRAPELDKFVTLAPGDNVALSFETSAAPGATVGLGLYDSWATNGQTTNLKPTTPTDLNGATAGTLIMPSTTATTYSWLASDAFADGGEADYYTDVAAVNDNAWYMTLENTTAAGVMNFNYNVSVAYSLNFAASTLIDHCSATEQAFDIGVNGAVLKVPYTYDTSSNFIRITNEHSESALITLDIFDESGNELTAVQIGSVGEHASVVYTADNLIDMAQNAGYVGTGKRHTMTFTVTAPKDSVHGVSVQKIPGGVDRVLPVLDTNIWQQ
ncbi:hypothetical protein [Paraglaciecola hydrolytica]|uniref:Uncharacterized protein n=1 Tax=Paraglaciecola hydrolytica TaxID=1799789 RepID=A0A135ZYT9_9ALTE|nr:hypothetical protein [Paraglaciecola hydrolytica]KXI28145.1 hypothetical protein AX660_17320 [Paraglaciecola hydrolytica]